MIRGMYSFVGPKPHLWWGLLVLCLVILRTGAQSPESSSSSQSSSVSAPDGGGGGPQSYPSELPCKDNNNRISEHGETYKMTECSRCTCTNSTLQCQFETCQPVTCFEPFKFPGECCRACPYNVTVNQVTPEIPGSQSIQEGRAENDLSVNLDILYANNREATSVSGQGLWKAAMWLSSDADGSTKLPGTNVDQVLTGGQQSQDLKKQGLASRNFRIDNIRYQVDMSDKTCDEAKYLCAKFDKGDDPQVEKAYLDFHFAGKPTEAALTGCSPIDDCKGGALVQVESVSPMVQGSAVVKEGVPNTVPVDLSVGYVDSERTTNVDGESLWTANMWLSGNMDGSRPLRGTMQERVLTPEQRSQSLVKDSTGVFNVNNIPYSFDLTGKSCNEAKYICAKFDKNKDAQPSKEYSSFEVEGVPNQRALTGCSPLENCKGATFTDMTWSREVGQMQYGVPAPLTIDATVSATPDSPSVQGSGLWKMNMFGSRSMNGSGVRLGERTRILDGFNKAKTLTDGGGPLELEGISTRFPMEDLGCGEYKYLCLEFMKGERPNPDYTFSTSSGERSIISCLPEECRTVYVSGVESTLSSSDPLFEGKPENQVQFNTIVQTTDESSPMVGRNMWRLNLYGSQNPDGSGPRLAPQEQVLDDYYSSRELMTPGSTLNFEPVNTQFDMTDVNCKQLKYLCTEFSRNPESSEEFELTPVPDPSILKSCMEVPDDMCQGVIVDDMDWQMDLLTDEVVSGRPTPVRFDVEVEPRPNTGSVSGDELWRVGAYGSTRPDGRGPRLGTQRQILTRDLSGTDLFSGQPLRFDDVNSEFDLTSIGCETEYQYLCLEFAKGLRAQPDFKFKAADGGDVITKCKEQDCRKGVKIEDLTVDNNDYSVLKENDPFNRVMFDLTAETTPDSGGVDGENLWELSLYGSSSENGVGRRFNEQRQVLSNYQQDKDAFPGEDIDFGMVDTNFNMQGLSCNEVRYLCAELRKGQRAEPNFELSPVPDRSVLKKCFRQKCDGIVIDSTDLSGEFNIDDLTEEVEFDVSVYSNPTSGEATGQNIWKLRTFVANKADGTGNTRTLDSQTLTPQQASRDLRSGQRLNFNNLAARINKEELNCEEGDKYICVKLERGDNPSIDYTLSGAREGSLQKCRKVNCVKSPTLVQGPRGDKGYPGEPAVLPREYMQGPPGLPGPAGRPGYKGPQGYTGPAGPQGHKGPSGDPGDYGYPGPPGPPGPAGPPGEALAPTYQQGYGSKSLPFGAGMGPQQVVQGPPGPVGPPGKAGDRGAQGIRGIVGPPGNTGPAGPTGPIGPRGSDGDDGRDGSNGNRGSIGLAGPTGAMGAHGMPGAPGAQGHKGWRGARGRKGETGDAGEVGDSGSRGATGPAGAVGARGNIGPSGERGERGAQGVAGTRGSDGSDGDTGNAGPQGATGPMGAMGGSGAKGDAGPQGDMGFQGLQGLRGENGNDGAPGATGATGNAGSDGSPGSVGDVGAAGAPGPGGAAGARGPSGTRGATGPGGASGDQGYPGLAGARGSDGPRGVTGGAGIRGEPGVDGSEGASGPDGPVGTTGPRGAAGARGGVGPGGPSGPAGALGMIGNVGEPGASGAPGEKGDPGNPGRTGSPGAPGQMGLPGSDGRYGNDGKPGPPGPSGSDGRPGPPGPNGMQGERGAPGLSGSRGVDGDEGRTGPAGPAGARGPSGVQGDDGPDGPAGPAGAQGSRGDTGAQGAAGGVGPNGGVGAPGARGAAGKRGAPGSAGPPGQAGAAGMAGDRGERGAMGLAGAAGPDGDAGADGRDGRDGEVGDKGGAGDVGRLGIPGLPGSPGTRGGIGAAGNVGAPGARGATGKRGAAGDQGARGNSGPPGPAGSPGLRGEQGGIGRSGRTGLPGPKGNPGERGRQGARGAQGIQGGPGAQGADGPRGQKGPRGAVGDQGVQGGVGPNGRAGPPGATGAQGSRGDVGEQGAVGPGGPAGPMGASGPMGAPGPRGAIGPPGASGRPGPVGQRGDTGAAGSPGIRGAPGPPGPSGSRGDDGRTGADGPAGPAGPAGPSGILGELGGMGAMGAPGPTGPAGRPGTDGAPGKRGAPGSDGPTGRPGSQGPKGPRGPTGSDGRNGIDGAPGAKGATGSQGDKGPQGAQGPAGVAGMPGRQGPAGSKGERGSRGPAGPAGPRGPAGADGEMGPAGPAGAAGARGETGATGIQGHKGWGGGPGAPGAQGPKGPAGAKGENGRPGPAGPAGIDGARGRNGNNGPQGPRGMAGSTGQRGASGRSGPAGPPGPPGRAGAPGALSYSGSAYSGSYGVSQVDKGPNPYSYYGDDAVIAEDDYDARIIQLRNQLEKLTVPNGEPEYPARSCKDLFKCRPILPSGFYTLDPSEGSHYDKFVAYCDKKTNATCIYPDRTEILRETYFLGNTEGAIDFSEMRDGSEISYSVSPVQLTLLRLIYSEAKQNLTYHCKNSHAVRNAEGNLRDALELVGPNGARMSIKSPKADLRYKVEGEDGCQAHDHTVGKTTVSYTTKKTERLPLVDFAVSDIGLPKQEFGVEVGPVCFS